MVIGHNKGTGLPTLRERLLTPKRWSCIFEHEGQMQIGQSDAPFEAAAMLQTAAEALEAIKLHLVDERQQMVDETGHDAPSACVAMQIASAALERLNQ